jgi:hypothetical protein
MRRMRILEKQKDKREMELQEAARKAALGPDE